MPVVALAAIAVALGTGAGHGRPAVALPAAVATIVALASSLAIRRVGTVVVLVALGCAAMSSASMRSDAIDDAVLPALAERGVVEVCGTARSLRPRSVEVRVERVERGGTVWRTSEAVRIAGRKATAIRAGEHVCAKGRIAPPREGFEEAPLLMAEHVGERAVSSRVRLAAGAVRARFSDVASQALPRTQAGLLLGMTDGDVALLDEATVEVFRTTGLAHLVAVSGSNVAVLLVVVMLVARRVIPGRRWLHAAAALPALAFFAFLTGLEASVLRAVVTASIALFVTVEGRTADGVRIASLAFVVLVLASPDLLFHPGFQLSYAATLGLILWARPLTEAIAQRLPASGAGLAVAACVGTTVAAQAAAAPLLAWHFGRIPALGGIANLVVAPLAPVVMIGGLVTMTAASLVAPLGWAPVLMRLPLDAILWTGRTFAELPSASLDAPVLIGVAFTAALAALLARSARARASFVAAALVACASAGGGALATGTCDGPSIAALDVGQGTAVLLRAGGHAVLVDGGPEKGDVVADLDAQGVGALDAVFVSHPHADHTQGIVDVVEEMDVGAVFGPVTLGWGTGADVVAAARREERPVTHVAAGDTFRFGDAIDIDVVFPEPGEEPVREENNVHAYSLVLRARVDGVDVLLPGDVGAEEERDLLDPADVGASVLIAPHHGSKDLDPAFVEAVGPRVVLVTVGEDNRYGHPAPEALRTYAAHGRVFRTDDHGTIVVCAEGGDVEVTTERGNA